MPDIPDNGAPGRVLLVASYFGVRNHTGGFRWRAIVPHLLAAGWEVDVLSMDRSTLEGFPEPLRQEPQPGLRVYALPEAWWGYALMQAGAAGFARLDALARRRAARGARPDGTVPAESRGPEAPSAAGPSAASGAKAALGRVAARARATLGGALQIVHDRRWARRALDLARDLADVHDYRAVVVTSPSHQAHLVGIGLKRSHGVPYVADFRDPMYFGRQEDLAALDPVTRSVWERGERAALRHLDAIVDISEGAQRAVEADPAYPGGAPRTYIRSGYVPRADVGRPDASRFRVVYTGWLYPFVDLDALFAACARLCARHEAAGDALAIEFMGTARAFNGRPLDAVAAAHGLGGAFRWHPRRPQRDAEALQESAAVLVAYDSVVARALCIPSKLYHYAQTYGDLLLIGNPEGAMAREAAKIGQRVYAPTDQAGLDACLDAAFRRWQAGAYQRPLDAEGVFDTARSAEAWVTLLDGLPTPTPASARGAPALNAAL